MEGALLILAANIIWFIVNGWHLALGWWIAGILMCLTIVGIPWGIAAFRIGWLAVWPFGRTAIDRELITGRDDLGTGTVGTIGNVLWFVLAGWWLAIWHLLWAIADFLTIILIPFSIQAFKLAGLVLAPIGKEIVPVEVADEARRRAAGRRLDRMG